VPSFHIISTSKVSYQHFHRPERRLMSREGIVEGGGTYISAGVRSFRSSRGTSRDVNMSECSVSITQAYSVQRDSRGHSFSEGCSEV
jgi:hypothetical protein